MLVQQKQCSTRKRVWKNRRSFLRDRRTGLGCPWRAGFGEGGDNYVVHLHVYIFSHASNGRQLKAFIIGRSLDRICFFFTQHKVVPVYLTTQDLHSRIVGIWVALNIPVDNIRGRLLTCPSTILSTSMREVKILYVWHFQEFFLVSWRPRAERGV